MRIVERIQCNPYRTLGVYVGSPASVELRNKNKIAAFARVGQTASFEFPIDGKLSPMKRTEASAEAAMLTLSLPKDRVMNALFWVSDGDSGWRSALNTAVEALLNGDWLDALYHYGNLFYDDRLRIGFLQEVTHGLLSMTDVELGAMFYDIISEQKDDIMEALIEARNDIISTPLIRQICMQMVIRDLDEMISLNDTVVLRMVNGGLQLDFYYSTDMLARKITELMPLMRIVARVYGEDSAYYQEASEHFAAEIYDKSTEIIQTIGNWVWKSNKNTIRNGEPENRESSRTERCTKKCMNLISKVDDTVCQAISDLSLSSTSARILAGARYKYERTLANCRCSDDSVIRESVRKHNRRRLACDILWLAILGLIFVLV